MCKINKKIILVIILVIGIINITQYVYASDAKINITKVTDEIIEGTIEVELDEDSNLTELASNTISQNIDAKTFYYSQLKNETSRNVYKELKKDTTGIGVTKVKFSNQIYNVNVNSFIKDKTYAINVINNQIKKYMLDALVAFYNDNPKIYWYYGASVNFTYTINKIKSTITYNSVTISSKISEKSNYKNFNQKLKEVVNSINGTSTYEIVKKCHDYICNTVVYTKKDNTVIDQTAYDALINKQGVCDAQARLFQLLCTEKGIKCIKVSGRNIQNNQSGFHAWNYVYHPDEKKWYAIDVTWDNKKDKGKATVYNYFLVGKNTTFKTSSGTVKFSENHIPGKKDYNIQTYVPEIPELSEEAYEKFSGKMQKSTNKKTNKPVTVTITFNRELKNAPTGWNLSANKKVITKTFSENTNEKCSVVNVRGEVLNGNINVTNIDKVAPEAVISYSSKERTSSNVKVTITGNEQLQALLGWSLSQDKKNLTKIYTENQKEDIIIKDLAGNMKNIPIEINNIDKTKPLLTIAYIIKDIADGKTEATIIANRELKPKEGWTLNEEKNSLTKIYVEDTTEELEIEDLEGNKSRLIINSNNIVEDFLTNVVYSTEEKTNKDIQVTITSNKQLQELEGWTLSQNKKNLTKIYSNNTKENIIIADISNNKKNETIEINNIDKEPPQLQIQYSDLNNSGEIMVTIISNEELVEKDNWTLSEDKKSITRFYNIAIEDNIIVEDLAGNEQTIKIQITEFQLSPIEDENNTNSIKDIEIDNNNTNNDEKIIDSIVEVENTSSQIIIRQNEQPTTETPKMTLPYTGNYIIIIYILTSIFTVLGIIFCLRYIRYKDIDKR